MDKITVQHSDTGVVARGAGTGGSRSLQVGGSAVLTASREVLDKAKQIAADVLEASVEDIVQLDDGRLGVAGAPASAKTLAELAATSELKAAADFQPGGSTFPFGAHIAVVEVDTQTGEVALLRHVAVDDCGTMINPMLVAGQVHGGVAQGAAQALYEEMVYDADGNPLTGNLMDYTMPSAADLPSFERGITETPTPMNPLGAKGIGESGTIGSTPAVQNAVVDALSHLGVKHIDMPCSPERVWRSIQDARSG
jgi:carbon-monoxide dehydrogenase large subunit